MSTRLKKSAKQVPTSKEAMEALVKETVAAQIECEGLISKRDAARVDADKPFAPRITELSNTMARNLELLEAYAESRRDEFGDSKSIVVNGHRMGWKLGNWKTALKAKVKWADVLAMLRQWAQGVPKSATFKAGERWLRIKEEPNKEAMIADRADEQSVPLLRELGVEIVQEETFYLAPDREGQEPALMTAQA